MKIKYFLLIGVMVLLGCPAPAQEAQTIKINQATDVAEFFGESRWLFPAFESGTVFLRQSRTQATLNYDLLTEQVFFIDAKKDTLALQNAKDVVIIQVGKRYFKYYNKALVEVMHRRGLNELWMRRQIKKTDTQKTGAYGLPSATSAVTNINAIDGGDRFREINVTEWAKYIRRVTFYLTDEAGKTRVANKSGFAKAFPKKKKQIETYLKTQPVNVENLTDLKRLFDFCVNE
ncbi:MAG: hypothetical protein LBF69_04535 [Prevotellaceae bacterium]|jgi:hypothetical protein|nr:hypothetical protein [Prevotellaceae bacterium]